MAVHERWLQHADRRLREAGSRKSAGRRAVVELLAHQRCLLSAQEIARQLHDQGAAGSQATVYRTLETLHELGLVHRFDAGDGVARFEPADPTGEHHHHLVDEDTGEVVDFEDAELERVLDGLGERLGIEITGHDVILRGHRRRTTS
jgi:Fur family transcriptional regulator, ferric uptake regulator